jgi:hypothetical protein
MEVGQDNMAEDVIGKGKLERRELILKGVDLVEFFDDIGDKFSGEESVVGVVDFGEFDDGLLGEFVEFGGVGEK